MSLEFNLEDFGLSPDDNRLELVKEYRQALINDGWIPEQHYHTESIELSTKLSKDGFTASVICRPRNTPTSPHQAHISIHGPDHGYVKLPEPYSWDEVVNNYRTRVYLRGFTTKEKFHNPTSIIVKCP